LTGLRAQYGSSALEPGELADVDALIDRLGYDERDLEGWAEDIDTSFDLPEIRKAVALTPEQVASNVQNSCVRLVPCLEAVIADSQAMTGAPLTTREGWNSVRLTRAMLEVVARRQTELNR
jgi:hypothetical protein